MSYHDNAQCRYHTFWLRAYVPPKEGRQPLDLARREGYPKTAELLQRLMVSAAEAMQEAAETPSAFSPGFDSDNEDEQDERQHQHRIRALGGRLRKFLLRT